MTSDEYEELMSASNKMDLINTLRVLDKFSLEKFMAYLGAKNSQNLIKSAISSLINEKEWQERKVCKIASLKEDLYHFRPDNVDNVDNLDDLGYLYFQEDEKEKHIRNLTNGFKLIAKKGDKFKLMKQFNEWVSENEEVVLEANFYSEEKFFTDVTEV